MQWPRAPDPSRVLEQMGSLGENLRRYARLADLLTSAVSCAVHPNAVDGRALAGTRRRAESTLASGALAAAAATDTVGSDGSIDIAALVRDWVDSLEAILPYFRSLAGVQSSDSGNAVAALGSQGGDFWKMVSLGAGGGQPGSSGEPHPLVAPAALKGSHAALLHTQVTPPLLSDSCMVHTAMHRKVLMT